MPSYDEDEWSLDDLRSLADAYWSLFRRKANDTTILDSAIQVTLCAVQRPQKPDNPGLCFDLGSRIKTRYELMSDPIDLSSAISWLQIAVDLTPDSDHAKAMRLGGLGDTLHRRFERFGQLDDLENAVKSLHCAAKRAIGPEYSKSAALRHYGSSLRTRYERVGEARDIDCSIHSLECARDLTHDDQTEQCLCLEGLASSLLLRFRRAGDPKDLERSIASIRCVVERSPEGDSNESLQLHTLGTALLARHERYGELEDLEAAISSHRRAVDLLPSGHPETPSRLNSLGKSLQVYFERVGEFESIEDAISSHRLAVSLTPHEHRRMPLWLNDQGNSLLMRFERSGEVEDIEGAVSSHRRALELTPESHPDMPLYLTNLALSLSMFSRRSKDIPLEDAVGTLQRAIELTPEDHSDKPLRLSRLCDELCNRFESSGDHSDISSALSAGRRAVDLTPGDHPNVVQRYTSLARCLQHQYSHGRDKDDITSAITLFRQTTQLVSDTHPLLSACYRNLGRAQRSLFEHDPTQSGFDTAVQSFMAAAAQPHGPPSIAFDSAMSCISMHSVYPEFSTIDSLLSVYSRVMITIPKLVWLGYSIDRRYDESAKLGEVVNAAVSVSISAGQLTQAVEWLEAGRALVWSQMLSLRTPHDELRASHPDLSISLEKIQRQLQQSAHSPFIPISETVRGVPRMSTNTAADHHRNLVIEYEGILEKIHKCAGFEDFQRAKPVLAQTTALSLLTGVVVYVNVHSSRCDALIVFSSGAITHVPLPQLSLAGAVELRRRWAERLGERGIRTRSRGLVSWDSLEEELNIPLECLWLWIGKPVIETLNLASPVKGKHLPHVVWCPSGPLMQLPLHAAGCYDEPGGPRIFNFVISSYTPSLSALLRAVVKNVNNEGTVPDVLLVTQPDTPDHCPLPGTMREGDRLQRILTLSGIASKVLDSREATVATVRAAIDQYQWVHLACHGSQDGKDPTRSAFALYDGQLSLSDIMGTESELAELAFLSACQTAVGDEKIPEESAHLAAGMLAAGFKGVVATMWSIGDADAPIVVRAFYKELIAFRATEGAGMEGTGAAYALHEATRVLREKVGETNFLRWVPFVHFGV